MPTNVIELGKQNGSNLFADCSERRTRRSAPAGLWLDRAQSGDLQSFSLPHRPHTTKLSGQISVSRSAGNVGPYKRDEGPNREAVSPAPAALVLRGSYGLHRLMCEDPNLSGTVQAP